MGPLKRPSTNRYRWIVLNAEAVTFVECRSTASGPRMLGNHLIEPGRG